MQRTQLKKLTRYSLGLGATICRWPTTFFVCTPVATNVRWPPSPSLSVKMRQEVNSIDFPACSTVLSTSSVLPSGAADTQVTCRSMVTDILKSSISNAAVAARHSGHTRLGTGAVGMEGIYELAWRTEGVNECARSPAVKIGGAVGDTSSDGQCNHKPPRLATYHLAVTEHIVGELPEVAFRSCVSSEDGLHRSRREWRHTTTNQLRPRVPGLCVTERPPRKLSEEGGTRLTTFSILRCAGRCLRWAGRAGRRLNDKESLMVHWGRPTTPAMARQHKLQVALLLEMDKKDSAQHVGMIVGLLPG